MHRDERDQIERSLQRVRWWTERISGGEAGPFLGSLTSIELHARTGLPVAGPLLDLRLMEAFLRLAEVNLSERLGTADSGTLSSPHPRLPLPERRRRHC